MTNDLLAKLGSDIWAIDPAAWLSLRESAGRRGLLDNLLSGVERPKLTVKDGVGTIPIVGPITQRPAVLERLFGFLGTEEIGDLIDQAEKDPAVKSVRFSIDSPGGTVTGIPELATKIADMRKPSIAVTDSICASAAYWLASSTDHIVATPSASVGSVGVFSALLDSSEALAQRGLKVDLFTSGPIKATGIDGVRLSDDQRQYLQGRVDSIFGMFRAHVESRRPRLAPDVFRGGTYLGAEAKFAGLVDELVGQPSAGRSPADATRANLEALGDQAIAAGRARIYGRSVQQFTRGA